MADIRLARPAAGTVQHIACTPDALFIFDFPAGDGTFSREGDNLVITFDDGGTLRQKLRFGRSLGVSAAFLMYPEVKDILGELLS